MDLGVTLLELAAALLLARGAVGHVCAETMLRRWTRPGPRPPISVLVAVQEPHDGLYEHLVALVCQRYPTFELVLAVDPAGAASAVVRRVCREFPALVRTVAPSGHPGLATLYAMARHDVVVITNSESLVGPQFLADLADGLADPWISVVQGLVVGQGPGLALGEAFRTLELFPRICMHVLLRRRRLPCDGPLLVCRARQEISEHTGVTVRGRTGFGLHVAPRRRSGRQSSVCREYIRWMRSRSAAAALSFAREPPGFAWLTGMVLLAASHGEAWLAWSSIVTIQAVLHVSLWRRIHGRSPPLLVLLALPVCESLALLAWLLGIVGRSFARLLRLCGLAWPRRIAQATRAADSQ